MAWRFWIHLLLTYSIISPARPTLELERHLNAFSHFEPVWFVDAFPLPVRDITPLCKAKDAHFCAVKCLPNEGYDSQTNTLLCCQGGKWAVGNNTAQTRHRNLMCGGLSPRALSWSWSASPKARKEWLYLTLSDSVSPVVPLTMKHSAVPRNLRVAFVGDTHMTEASLKVFQMIKEWAGEVTDSFAIINGDMDYRGPADPTLYNHLLDETLGPEFPVFVTVGNHDHAWWYEFGDGSGGYSNVFAKRYRKTDLDKHCLGEVGVNFVCLYKGILLVQSGIGEMAPKDDPGYLAFLEHAFTDNLETTWRFASWHKNQKFLQLCSKKEDAIGWRPYEICRENGAIVNNAHEHRYLGFGITF